jgi:uncharacterized protein (UPF0147 family)
MDKTTGINRANTSNPSQSKNQSNQINEVSSKEKKPVLSSKLDGLLDKTDELLKREKAWKNDNLSNEAKESLIKTARLMKTKTSDSQVNKAKRQAFSESEQVSNHQKEKFGKLLELAPISVLKEITEVKKFPTLNAAELYEVLFTENAFAIFKNTEEGHSFATNLLSAINKKISEMEPGDKGLALVLRFPSCYNNIGHIALASVWRDTKGKLQLSICHQESVIPHIKNNGDGKPQKIESYTGIIYNTFDTSADYPNNISPVIESMKLCGPPSVLVFPCPYPENLEKYTAMMKDTVFDYGAADPWRMPDDKKIAKNLPFQTCFNVTQRSLAVLYGLPIQYKSTLAGNFDELSKFSGVDEKITEKYIIGKNEFLSREEMKNLIEEAKKNPASKNKRYENIIVVGFVQVGENWINPENADVKGTTQSKKGRVTIQPGSTTFNLANDAVKFKFVTENKLLENLEINDSNNKSVIKDKVYTADDVEKMRLKEISKKSVVFDYVYAIKINSTINQVNVGKAKL